ncbi:MAG: dephospho-CoA kinase [Lachnospiraceae bacterium]|nr:dephospho-CoA kinase [Lachnospiraceae bacterium]
MKKIGITGGVGAGKSAVLAYLKEKYGAYLIVADELAKELELPQGPCYQPLIDAFGTGILDAEGVLDKKAFAALIFSEAGKLERANAIIHPAVKEEILKRMKEEEAKGTKLFVLEAALLIEEHYDEILDELWYVFAEEEIRIRRLAESRSYSREKAISIMKNQKSDAEFRMHCEHIIDNSGDLQETRDQIDAILYSGDGMLS